jgi:hypothetical protein
MVTLVWTVPDSPSLAPPERSEDMHPSRPCLLCPRLALLLSLMLLTGLAGCGPASSDNAPSLESRASVGGPPLSKQGPSPGNMPLTPITLAASPLPFASENLTGATSGRGIVPGGDNIGQGDKLLSKPAGAPNVETDGREKLPVPVIPDSIAKDLDSPDARVRLEALDHWGAQGTKAPLDPLFVAMDDEDEAVRRKATEIIERYWGAEHEGKWK